MSPSRACLLYPPCGMTCTECRDGRAVQPHDVGGKVSVEHEDVVGGQLAASALAS